MYFFRESSLRSSPSDVAGIDYFEFEWYFLSNISMKVVGLN